EGGAQPMGAIKIGTDLVQIAPDLVIEGRLASVHYADHLPLALAEAESLAELRVGMPPSDGLADNDLALPGLEPAALIDSDIPHLDPTRRQASHRDVHVLGFIDSREIDHRHHFEGSHRGARLA